MCLPDSDSRPDRYQTQSSRTVNAGGQGHSQKAGIREARYIEHYRGYMVKPSPGIARGLGKRLFASCRVLADMFRHTWAELPASKSVSVGDIRYEGDWKDCCLSHRPW